MYLCTVMYFVVHWCSIYYIQIDLIFYHYHRILESIKCLLVEELRLQIRNWAGRQCCAILAREREKHTFSVVFDILDWAVTVPLCLNARHNPHHAWAVRAQVNIGRRILWNIKIDVRIKRWLTYFGYLNRGMGFSISLHWLCTNTVPLIVCYNAYFLEVSIIVPFQETWQLCIWRLVWFPDSKEGFGNSLLITTCS